MLLWMNMTHGDVLFANDHTAVLMYKGAEAVHLGARVMYQVSPEWWGYVGKVIATFAHNFTQELFVQYDTSIAGFSNMSDAYDYFDKVL